MSSTDLNQELARLHSISVGESWIKDPQNMLAAALKDIPHDYFFRDRAKRQSAEELLSDSDKAASMLLYQLVASSKLSDLCKQRVCGAVIFFLENTTHMTPKEISEFKKTSPGLDPDNMFDGLQEPDGE